MRHWTIIVLATIVAPFMAIAQHSAMPDLNLNGFCFAPDPCAGEISIQRGEFSTCEETCNLRVTQAYPKFDALGLELSCRGDGQPSWTEFALSAPHWTHSSAKYLITDTKSYTLVPCGTEQQASDDGGVQLGGPELVRQLFNELPQADRILIQQRVAEAGHFDDPVDGGFSAALLIALMQYADSDLGHPQAVGLLFADMLSEGPVFVQEHGNGYFPIEESSVEYAEVSGLGEVSYFSTGRDFLFYEIFAISYAIGHKCLGDFDLVAVSKFARESLGYDPQAWNLLLQFAQFGIPVTLESNFDTERVLGILREKGNGFAIVMSIKVDEMLSSTIADNECEPQMDELEATWQEFVRDFTHPDRPVVDIRFLRRVDRTSQTLERANSASPERRQMCDMLVFGALHLAVTMLKNGADISVTITEIFNSFRDYPQFDFVFFNSELQELVTNTRRRRSILSNSRELQQVHLRCLAR